MGGPQPTGSELRTAAFRGDAAYCRTLILNGADVNDANPTNGETALHRAVAGRGTSSLSAADMTPEERRRRLDEEQRVTHRQIEVVNMLLRYKADPNAATIGGLTPLHCCTTQETARALLSGGADPGAAGQGKCYAIGGQPHIFQQAGAQAERPPLAATPARVELKCALGRPQAPRAASG